MRILLVTVSARGHAIAEALARSPQHPEIIHVCTVRNPGIRRLAKEQHIVSSLMDFPTILAIAKQAKPDFVFIAPDDPIGGGLADELEKRGIPSVAPKKALAKIEASKSFARELLRKYGIEASPKYKVFHQRIRNQELGIRKYIEEELRGDYVVKFDALAGGKGVKVSGEHLSSVEEGVAYALECIEKGGKVVVEEKLLGVEFSLMSFVSGKTTVDMPPVQDHKRAYEGDTGPNTGGMGSYSDANHLLPFLKKEDLEAASQVNRRVAKALMEECGEPYRGILYGGYMLTRDGVKVIEFNARFGDPEALNVLPLLETDFVAICQSIIEGTLNKDLVRFSNKATVCKYIVPKSYPERKDEKGQRVVFPSKDVSFERELDASVEKHAASPLAPSELSRGKQQKNTRMYYGDIFEAPDGSLYLGGSRTAGIVGIGETLDEAESIAQALCEKVSGPVRFRSDIGTRELMQRRIDATKNL